MDISICFTRLRISLWMNRSPCRGIALTCTTGPAVPEVHAASTVSFTPPVLPEAFLISISDCLDAAVAASCISANSQQTTSAGRGLPCTAVGASAGGTARMMPMHWWPYGGTETNCLMMNEQEWGFLLTHKGCGNRCATIGSQMAGSLYFQIALITTAIKIVLIPSYRSTDFEVGRICSCR